MKKQSFRRRKQSAKRRRRRRKSFSAIDRVSQLPQPILHNILSLLSQRDAVRTSVLSKSWRYLWHGRLNVEFRYNWFARKNVFFSFLDRTLQRYLDQNLSLQKFLVYNEYEVDFVLLQKWIPVLIMNIGVRSFNISFHESSNFFPLPLVVFQSESLVELHLQRCDLKILESTYNVVMLKNLQTLRLHYVYITDEIFEKIISGCPLIENLDMFMCSGFKSIKLHKHHIIKNLPCFLDERCIIEAEDPHTLESFYIENRCLNWSLPHKNMHFPHLKSLKLQDVKLNADTFSNFSSFFPCLNELIINNCNGFEEFSLLSSSIKRLTIIMGLKNRIKAFFDTPNILYFEYSCDGDAVLPSIKFTTTSNEWKSKISLSCKLERSDKDLLELNKLLKALNQSHITLSLYHTVFRKKLDIDDSYGGICWKRVDQF
ncbi:hypothetical protein CASFOL_021910 [Castilleja foliolosa]|uniref:F-box domain-containing protein n=1 Tax=Castilleja foliolosa TaxID=1961234 RepID=A0ABD3D1F4_9LAMI